MLLYRVSSVRGRGGLTVCSWIILACKITQEQSEETGQKMTFIAEPQHLSQFLTQKLRPVAKTFNVCIRKLS